MAGDRKKSKYVRRPAWRVRWHLIESVLLTETFPDRDGYGGSRWDEWERRIKQGHKAEEKQIERIYNERKKHPADNPLYDPDEWAGEDYHETCRLTNSMYAALVVSLWSEMEHFLRSVLSVCQIETGSRKKAEDEAKALCLGFSQGKTTAGYRRACIGALNRIEARDRTGFGVLKDQLFQEVRVACGQCKAFYGINAIRILSNCYKHNDGHYRPQGDKDNEIRPSLLRRWGILKERNEIDYSNLPIRELVTACNVFCRDLLGKVESELEKRATRRSSE